MSELSDHPGALGPGVYGPPEAPPEPPVDPRRRARIVVVAAVLAGLVLVGLAVMVPVAVDVWRNATGRTLKAVKVYEVRASHTDQEVEYDPQPAPGGPHDPIWLECGVYDEPVREENAEHSLEHGTVWITYDPDRVSADDIGDLEDALPAEGILSPYPGQSAPVIVTVWERQLELNGAGDRRLGLFLVEYGDGHTSPEPMASCAGGLRILDTGEDVTGTLA